MRNFIFLTLFLLALYTLTFGLITKRNSINGDGYGYYAYLPSLFLYHDLKTPNAARYSPQEYLLSYPIFHQLDNGNIINKYPIGLALIWLPAFMLSILISFVLNIEVDAYSLIFQYLIGMTTPIFLSLGIVFIYKILSQQQQLSKISGLWTIIALTFGTNLLHYSKVDVSMSHVYAFSLMAMSIYLIGKWHKRADSLTSVGLGLVMGLLMLVRLSHVVVILLWLFYSVYSIKSLKSKINYFFKNKVQVTLVLATILFCLSLQIWYFYAVSGSLWYFAYQGEFFNWLDPAWYGVLFSYRKGLVFWTPVLLLSVLGLRRFSSFKKWILPSFLVLGLGSYIIASWHAWWYGDSFGHRGFIDFYPLFAIWIGQGIESLKAKFIRNFVYLGIIFLCLFNLYLMQLYWRGILPRDNTTKEMFIRAVFSTPAIH